MPHELFAFGTEKLQKKRNFSRQMEVHENRIYWSKDDLLSGAAAANQNVPDRKKDLYQWTTQGQAVRVTYRDDQELMRSCRKSQHVPDLVMKCSALFAPNSATGLIV